MRFDQPLLGSGLDEFFDSSGIAIIGASNDPNRIGGRPIAFMRRAGYAGALYPVNPTRPEIQGLPAYASILDVPDPLQHAVIAVPAEAVASAVAECIARGVKAITIFTSGFAEVGEEGASLQRALRDQCFTAGVRLLGPNCLGLMNVPTGMLLTFSTVVDCVPLHSGSVSMVTQSGAFGAYFCGLASQRGVGFSRFVATGNEADIDIADCIAWLARDPKTSVIAAYIEGCRNGQRLRDALALARENGKPVLVYKAGSSDAGAAAVSSHTGSLAGADVIWDTIFHSTGAQRAFSVQQLVDAAYAFSFGVRAKGRSVGIISGSGGVGIALADAVSNAGLDLRPMPQTAQAEIKRIHPYASALNPVDTTAQVVNDLTLFGRMLKIMLSDGKYDSVIVFLMQYGYDEVFFAPWKKALLEAKQAFPDRLFVLCMSAPESVTRFLESHGFLIFDDPVRAANAIAMLADKYPPAAVKRPESDRVESVNSGGAIALDEHQSRLTLQEAGIPFVPQQAATSADEAVRIARELGYPVVLKILSPDILHKSEVGGVRLSLMDESGVRAAWSSIMSDVKRAAPTAAINGILVAKMVTGGIETIIGVHRDKTFGPMTMFGLGGISVELFGDVVFRAAPITVEDARQMLSEIKGYPLLAGFRGRPEIDRTALAETLASISRLIAADGCIESAEINPFIALPEGGFAVDALVIRRTVATTKAD